MGGCRCTFRQCENGTATKPGMHFFHFPIRDWPRLERWAAYADKLEFKELPLSKLKNKVVCEDHFRNKMFMNYLKEGLTKTAVPTLDVLEDGRVWDVETNLISEREEWIIDKSQNKPDDPLLMIATNEHSTRMQIQFVDTQEIIEEETINVSPIRNKQPVLLNKHANTAVVKPEKPKVLIPTTPPSNAILRKVVIKRKNTSTDSPGTSKVQLLSIQRMPKKEILKPTEQPEECPTEEAPSAATPSSSTDISTVQSPVAPQVMVVPPPTPIIDPILLEKIEQTTSEIAKMKKLLEDVLNKPVPEPKVITVEVPAPVQLQPPQESSSPKLEKGASLNKVQLFSGIKRYLNPTMVALLRMEMFGGAKERQWKTDEKTLAVELLGLGENVYDHFCDEFRFRLPAKKDVQKWKEQELDDDDAS